MGRSGGINWQELWALKTALEPWGDRLSGNLVLARMDNGAAAASAAYAMAHLALLARSIKELETPLGCTAVALHNAGRRNALADAVYRAGAWIRIGIRAGGCGPTSARGGRALWRD